jgi:hypothetical protein
MPIRQYGKLMEIVLPLPSPRIYGVYDSVRVVPDQASATFMPHVETIGLALDDAREAILVVTVPGLKVKGVAVAGITRAAPDEVLEPGEHSYKRSLA